MAGLTRTSQRLCRSIWNFRFCNVLASVSHRMTSSGTVDLPDMEPPIPPYTEKVGEETDTKRGRLLYQSRKRGMTENGLLLSTFASKHLASLTESQLTLYDRLINQPTNDWEIYYWVTGAKPTPAEYNNEIMTMLQDHAKNKDKDYRMQQPDLYS